MSEETPERSLPEIEARLGYRFADPGLLRKALTHRSHAYEYGVGGVDHYERLEFLGDALLGFIVSEWLWREDPDASEGVLSRRMQGVVRAKTLARAAKDLGLGEALRLGRGEESTGGRLKPSLLADVFEAVLGAVFVDGGLEAAREFVLRHLGDRLREACGISELVDDYKTRLQEAVQQRSQQTPRYRIVGTSGPPHAMEFRVEVLVGDQVLGSGSGTSRKRAEQRAACEGLRALTSEARGSSDGTRQ